MKLMEYQNKRGGRVLLHGIMKPCETTWGNGLEAMKHALVLEKDVYQALLDLHNTASRNEDPQLQDFLESNYLGEQVDSIKQLSDYINTLSRMEAAGQYALGEYQFDKITLGGEKKD
ncbi:ferritin, middle subunit-like [Pocillopora damicornis]|uniref:ferritin, middle subunit-like n=1 Tax=Pocillopora damicornis TaxID=46731 RepID=UPI000F55013A|nr:ferritin, middle subunit-like [Pocillopora damicornis]